MTNHDTGPASSCEGRASDTTLIEARLHRLTELGRNARRLWFVQLGFLGVCVIALAGVEDADFFAVDADTSLPLPGVSVPTDFFFYAGSFLAAVLYIHFLRYLHQIWRLLAELPRYSAGDRMEGRLPPCLLIESVTMLRNIPGGFWGLPRWFRRHFMRGIGGSSLDRHPFPLFSVALAAVFVWGAGLLVVSLFWLRAMPSRDLTLVLWNAMLLFVCLYVAIQTAQNFSMRSTAGSRAPRPNSSSVPFARLIRSRLRYSGLGILLAVLSLYGVHVAEADLFQARLAERPTDWQDHDVAKTEYREQYTARLHTEYGPVGAWPGDWEVSFEEEWENRRNAYLSGIRFRDLSGHDFRKANMQKAFLARTWLAEAQLDNADLSGAWLEGAYLRGARLQNARLSRARLQGAVFTDAHLEDADLGWARLQGAELFGARLDGASLLGANLEGADLSEAWLEGAYLTGARLDEAYLWETRLEGADLLGAHLNGAFLAGARLERSNLWGAQLVGAHLRHARLDEAHLRGAHMEGTLLWEARLRKANLREARLMGASLFGATLEGANLTGARLDGTDLRGADLRQSEGLTQEQLNGAIGDENTILPDEPEGLYVYDCWPEFPSLPEGVERPALWDSEGYQNCVLCRPECEPRPTGTPVSELAAER